MVRAFRKSVKDRLAGVAALSHYELSESLDTASRASPAPEGVLPRLVQARTKTGSEKMSTSIQTQLTVRSAIMQRIADADVPALPHPGSYVSLSPHSLNVDESLRLSGADVITFDQIATLLSPQRFLSVVPGIPSSPDVTAGNYSGVQLLNLQMTLCTAEFFVKETGAVWVPASALPEPAALFTCEHLVVVVNPREEVPTMTEALQRVSRDGDPRGYFIAGPSKTADIEQCLVIGAQGARRMTVVLKPDHD